MIGNSDFEWLSSNEAIQKAIEAIEAKGIGKVKPITDCVTLFLADNVIGEPFQYTIKEKHLT